LIINRLKTNHVVNPLGFDYADGGIRLSFVTAETAAQKQLAARVEVALDESFSAIVFDSGKDETIDSRAFLLPLAVKPRTRYFWRVSVWADNGDFAVSEPAWFETAKIDEPWQAQWITPDFDPSQHPVLLKSFRADKPVKSARAYVCGLGLYELYINGKKAGDEYLTPSYNDYDTWLQYQTYDVTTLLSRENDIEVTLGNGWYKGRFGFDTMSDRINLFGDRFTLLYEMHIEYADGSTAVISTDTSWAARRSCIMESSIYDGEVHDATFDTSARFGTKPVIVDSTRLKARISLPMLIKERIKPIAILLTPKGETILDMGQNMVGWVEFRTNAPKGTRIHFDHGEILQQDCFFRLNLRTAKAAYTYISDGTNAIVRPYFTFYGFRYVKIEGWPGEVSLDDFEGCVVYSDMEQTGTIETSDPLVNRLFLNALWGQKGNFLDTPTDCPQRDERMGWTGDAQMFCGTASFNMDTYAFFSKYLFDLHQEQKKQNGCVPYVVPDMIREEEYGTGSCAWGDAATVVPWTTYVHYGDKAILAQQFDSMKGWVDYIRRVDEANGKRDLWMTGRHFADWLAIDDSTDPYFIASAYYFFSAQLTAKAARVLGKDAEAAEYGALADAIRVAITREFFTETGRLAVPTQTGMVLSLFMDFVPAPFRERLIADLRNKMEKSNNYLTTGFVGTPYLNRALSDNGLNDIAYTLLMNKDYPSWLYEVIMGATTVWERWNSLLPDGTISDLTMNSFNHYAYGSVIEWVYRNVSGLQPTEDCPGFKRVTLAPQPDGRLEWVRTSYDSAMGRYESNWSIGKAGRLSYSFTIPFNAEADLALPRVSDCAGVTVNGKPFAESGLTCKTCGASLCTTLTSGKWTFAYMPTALSE